MLKNLGAKIEEDFLEIGGDFIHQVSVSGDSVLKAKDFYVPSDISSAAFFAVAAACLKNSEIVIKNVGLNPTRTAFLDVLKRFGANFEISDRKENGGESIGELRVFGKNENQPANNLIEGEIIANLIDEVPILAVFGTQIFGGLEIRNAAELRVKESDRIAAVVENFKANECQDRRISRRFASSKIRFERCENRIFRRSPDCDGVFDCRTFCRR